MPSARADAAGFSLIIQRELGETLAAALLTVDGLAVGRVSAAGSDVACAEQPAATPRLAVVLYPPTPPETSACQQQAASDVLALTIGYQAIALVAPASAPVFSLQSADLFRAAAAHAGGPAVPASWHDVDAKLPDLPVGLLAPPTSSAADRLLTTEVLEPACRQGRGEPVPFQLASRLEFCGALRASPDIVRRQGGRSELLAWAASAPAGHLAVIGLAELRQLEGVVLTLPLDGVLPTAANVVGGRYRAAEKVTLLIVVPHATATSRRDELRRAMFELLAERNIGPEGSLALAGLIPLPPGERVAARSQALAIVEQP